MKKYLHSILFVIISIFVLAIPVSAEYADQVVSIDHIIYSRTEGESSWVAQYDFKYLKEENADKLTIKSEVDGARVSCIESQGFMMTNVSAIEIPNSVGQIGYYAFGRSAIKNLVIPSGVTYADRFLAQDCKNLKSVEWNTGKTTSIPQCAFDGCTQLEKVSIIPGVKTIENAAFASCSSLKTISLPDSVKRIGLQAFANCTSLEEIYIPYSVTSIEGKAFIGDTKLTICGEINSYAYYYAKANDIPFKSVGSEQRPASNRAFIKSADVTGNTLKVSLLDKVPGATYIYYIVGSAVYDDMKEIETRTIRKVESSKASVTMYNMPKGDCQVYCQTIKKGRKYWSNGKYFTVKQAPVKTPKMKSVKVSGNTVTVTFSNLSGSKGYDCVLAKDWVNDKAYEPIYVKKNHTSTKVTFKNVKPGVYYVAAHAFVREKVTSGKKVFSNWSNYQIITVE